MFGIMSASLLRRFAETQANHAQPVVSHRTWVVIKRTLDSGGVGGCPASTSYFATFEYADGSHEEFSVPGAQYGSLAEGDQGTLWRQGIWFTEFRRQLPAE